MRKSWLVLLLVMLLSSAGYIFATDDAFNDSSSDATELSNAVDRMYQNEFTFADTVEKFKPNSFIRREEAAKFFVQFATQMLDLTGNTALTTCSRFSDSSQTTLSLRSFVTSACQLGILKGANKKIKPKDFLMNAHAIAILIRLIDPTVKDAAGTNWANNYYRKANKLELLAGLNVNNRKSLISRGTVAILLYRAAQLQSDFVDAAHTGAVITGADLIISSIGLDASYTDPTAGDALAHFKLKVKNIGHSSFLGQSILYPPLTLRCTGSNHIVLMASNINLTTGASSYNYTLAPQQTLTFNTTTLANSAILATGGLVNASCYLAVATGFVDIDTGNNEYDFGFEILE